MSMLIGAEDVAGELGVSKSKAYTIIRKLNGELAARGFLVIQGKCPRKYFQEKLYGFSSECNEQFLLKK